MTTIIAHEHATTRCPAWCEGGRHLGDVHLGLLKLDADTEILLCRTADDTLTIDVLGEPSDIAETGTVRLTADAIARLAAILSGL